MEELLKIMIVEDNLRACHALKALLSQQTGIAVVSEASNGAEAIQQLGQQLDQQLPDIIIMDIEMPVLNGLDATKLIKQKWPRIRIIILTMYPDYRPAARLAGADAFLTKGGLMDELTCAIRALFQAP